MISRLRDALAHALNCDGATICGRCVAARALLDTAAIPSNYRWEGVVVWNLYPRGGGPAVVMRRVARDPRRGEYAVNDAGAISFSPEDEDAMIAIDPPLVRASREPPRTVPTPPRSEIRTDTDWREVIEKRDAYWRGVAEREATARKIEELRAVIDEVEDALVRADPDGAIGDAAAIDLAAAVRLLVSKVRCWKSGKER